MKTSPLRNGITALFLIFSYFAYEAQTMPNADFTYTVSGNGNVNFTSTSTNTYSNTVYKWLFGDGTSTTSAQSQTASHTYTTNGNYATVLVLMSPTGVIWDSTTKSVPINTIFTGLKNKGSPGADIAVYPNPAKDVLNIELDLQGYKDLTLTLYDITGRAVHTERIEALHNFQLNTRNYNSGTYILQLRYDEKMLMTRKVVIVKD